MNERLKPDDRLESVTRWSTPWLVAIISSLVLASGQTTTERLNRLLREDILIDTHVDTPWYMVDEGYDLAEEHGYYQADIPRLRRGHVGAIFFGIPVEPQNF